MLIRSFLAPCLLALLSAACTSIGGGSGSYRVKVGDQVVQCAKQADTACGLTLTDCTNKHEYHCLHGIDLELADAGAPLPPPAAALAPPPAAPLLPPAPAAPSAPHK